MSMSTMSIFKTEVLYLVTYVTTAVFNDYYSEVMAYAVLAYSVFMTRMDTKVMPTNNTEYSCHIKP